MRAESERQSPMSASALLLARLIRRLADEWESINWQLFGDAMRAPAFELHEGEQTLGLWRARERTIALSMSAVLSRPWLETLETLKHEAAHQFVDEVLGGEASPHGPMFKQVCAARGIDSRAVSPPSSGADRRDDPEDRVIARVQKLLALAVSSNQHEAELAASTAQRIMLKYNLDLQRQPTTEGDDCGYAWLGEPTGRVQAHERNLAGLLAEHYFVQAIWIPVYRPLEGKRGSVLELCGRVENLKMAEFVHGFLLRTTQRLWDEHKRRHDIRSDRDRRSFLAGAVSGFGAKLRVKRSEGQAEGLVWVGDAHVNAYFKRRHPRVRSTGSTSGGSAAAYANGQSAGREIVLSRPVSESRVSSQPRAITAGK
ncbi:MAG: DUF2786 domain-containing protein [Nannocystaceae bacterium]|nr:DUF2786 domain-containing protein [Nannocystaceae bacterium]